MTAKFVFIKDLKICLLAISAVLAFAAPSFAEGFMSQAEIQSEIDRIKAAIAASGSRWHAGETPLSRLSPSERRMRLGHLPEGTVSRVSTAASLGGSTTTLSVAPQPATLDWRSNGGNYVTGVRDQGDCGSCWAFGPVAALEAKTLIINNTPGIDLDLSEQTVVSCSGLGSCLGGYLPTDYFVTTGVPTEPCYPYTATNGKCSYAYPSWNQYAYKAASYTWIAPTSSQTYVDALKSALNTYGPIVVAFDVYYDFYSYNSGIYSYTSGGYEGGHAVLLVGYDDASSCFIVKNSWGTGWGEGGYFRIAYSETTGMTKFGQDALAYGGAIAYQSPSDTKQTGTSGDDRAYGVAVDSAGNVYAAGYTNGSLDGNTSAGGIDAVVQKYGSTGTKLWTKQMGTASDDYAKGVAVDGGGNVYAAGYTNGVLDGTNAGGYDLFVVKYDTDGNKVWTRQLGTATDDYATSVAVDGAGGVYVAGYTSAGLDGETSAGGKDLFLVKYNTSGVKQWTKQLGTASDDYAKGVALDGGGDVYVTGFTYGGLDGGSNAGGADLFVVKYDTNGNKLWTKQLGSASDDYATGVAVDASGNVYAGGFTYGGLDGNTNAGMYDLFVVKYDTDGVKQWTRQTGSSSYDYSSGVAVDTGGSVYVTGYTYGALDGNTSAGGFDLYVAKYNTDGVKQWSQQAGSATEDYATGVSVDAYGDVYVAGFTNGGLDGNTNAGGYDLFVLKLTLPASPVTLSVSANPANSGSPVTFTASASGGSGSYEYCFWLYGPGTGNTWVLKSAYSTSDTWTWTPTAADKGSSLVYVWARNAGSTARWESPAGVSVSVTVPPSAVNLVNSPSQTVYYTGNTVTLTATASGGSGPYEYKFWLVSPAPLSNWSLKQDYSSTNSFAWTPSSANIGTNYVIVWARNAGSTAYYEAYAYTAMTVSTPVAPTSATLTATSSTAYTGNVNTFTASASGGSGPYEYRFWLVSPSGTWTEKAAYSTTKTWSWTPSSPDIGTNYVIVWARNVGSSASYEAYASYAISVKAPVAPTSARLTASPSMVYAGRAVTFSATASGGSGPYQYKFWLISPVGAWTLKQDYSSANTLAWTPSTSDRGTNTVVVWVRNAGSSASYETYASYSVAVR